MAMTDPENAGTDATRIDLLRLTGNSHLTTQGDYADRAEPLPSRN